MTDFAIRVGNLGKRCPSAGLRAGRIGTKRKRYERSAESEAQNYQNNGLSL